MERKLKTSRFMYILEAGFEYLIAILVSTTFLATLTEELGMSDSLTGILSSVVSLGCVFQLGSMLIRGKSQKRLVTVLSILNQFLFMLLYVIPLFPINGEIKIVLFVVTIILAYLLYNLAHPKKINWLMSLVDDTKRGSFTANKEIISLVMGILFNFGMGTVVDHFKEIGQTRTAFAISAVTILGLMILHTVTLLVAVEKPLPEQTAKPKLLENAVAIFMDKNIQHVAILFVLWNTAQYVAVPFYGTYQIKELGFSLKFVSLFTMISHVVRILFSKVLGKYADKRSFAAMIKICFLMAALGFGVNMFTVPENGKVFFAVYSVCYAIAMAGINSSLINLVFDYVPVEKRSDSLAVCLSCGGVAGFLVTLCASVLVSHIQESGNSFIGISNIYAQQVVSGMAMLFAIVCILYVTFVMQRSRKETNSGKL